MQTNNIFSAPFACDCPPWTELHKKLGAALMVEYDVPSSF